MDLILHHFDASPFAEKARLAFGIKRLTWGSVEIPMIMPKPDLMPLTGGYRKTPVLQCGAEVYCDTRLILDELERRYPEPTLFPNHSGPLVKALACWSDTRFFEPGAGLSMGLNSDIPEPLLKDRTAFFKFMDFSRLEESLDHLWGQFLSQVNLVQEQLSDGRSFVLGEQISAADILYYFPLWMARGNFPQVGDWLTEFGRVLRWEQHMQQVGHGQRENVSAETALALAKKSEPEAGAGVQSGPGGFTSNQKVTVTPTDYGNVPVEGQLITLSHDRITLRRVDDQVGEVNTHFPRAGYRVDVN